MTSITVSEARANLYHLIDEAAASHQPLLISGNGNNIVLTKWGPAATKAEDV